MTTVLALTDSTEDIRHFCPEGSTFVFRIQLLPAHEHTFEHFEEIYRTLKEACDLSTIDVVVAEYVESLPLLYFMRRDGYSCPALMVPHNNPYPLHILCYFLLLAAYSHPGDLVLCGSQNASRAYEHLTGIRASAICTFGISEVYRPLPRAAARRRLGLPSDRTILLYTGRFMNDKGLEPLLAVARALREEDPRILLALSTTHIDPPYFNRLAARMEGVVLFNRLDKAETAHLYSAADLFVSCATSVFETYAKSALEALACGVPVVVPRWDGFPYYVDDTNGALVDVEFLPEPVDPVANPYEFARVDVDDCVAACRLVLARPGPLAYEVPEWARYERTMRLLPGLIEDMARVPAHTSSAAAADGPGTADGPGAADGPRPLDLERLPRPVVALLKHYGLTDASTLLRRADALGLLDQTDPGERRLLRELHNELFSVMERERARAGQEGVAG
ncbi:glycosyltransferase family 4 protein [Streptomyces sp. NPDC059009]|uniref:glycosyltransferase family 4 protein n=1 Tax=Streptomyces sp. NPDC059009 TaxID=3346694 RepID=UPI00368BF601